MKASYGEVSVDHLDFTGVEVRIGNRSDALALLDDMIEAGGMEGLESPDVPLKALRDAIEREIV
jgi:hypothetical protein